MKFNSLPVHDLTDATRDFEQLQIQGIFNDTALGGALAGKLPNPGLATGIVLELLTTGTKRQLAIGNDSVTFTASVSSAGKTVTHNLGRVPLFVCGFNNGGNQIFMTALTYTTTQVTFLGASATAITGTVTFQWIAIG